MEADAGQRLRPQLSHLSAAQWLRPGLVFSPTALMMGRVFRIPSLCRMDSVCMCVCVLCLVRGRPRHPNVNNNICMATVTVGSVCLRERPDDAKGYGRDLEGHFPLATACCASRDRFTGIEVWSFSYLMLW